MMSRRNYGSGGRRTRDMTSPNTRWGNFCKAKRERRRQYPGTEKRRPRGTPGPPTAWESCIWRGKMSRKTCQKRWPTSPTPPNTGTSMPSTLWEKLYLTSQDVKQDREQAWAYFYESAEQGNEYADFFLEHFDQARRPNVFLSATKLLHHLSQIFRDNSVPPAAPVGQHVDRKLRRKIQEKKIAMGHKPDDHEETPRQDMGGMTMG